MSSERNRLSAMVSSNTLSSEGNRTAAKAKKGQTRVYVATQNETKKISENEIKTHREEKRKETKRE